MRDDSVMVALHFYPEELERYREQAQQMGMSLERALEATVRAWHFMQFANERKVKDLKISGE